MEKSDSILSWHAEFSDEKLANIVQHSYIYNLADFLPKDEWLPNSADLNQLNYFAWGYMLNKLNNVKCTNFNHLRSAIERVWDAY